VLGRATGLVIGPGRSAAQRSISAIVDKPCSCSRSSGGAVTSSPLSVIERWDRDHSRRARPPEIALLRAAGYGLTRREQDVVRLVLLGDDTAAIGARLFLSPWTVQDPDFPTSTGGHQVHGDFRDDNNGSGSQGSAPIGGERPDDEDVEHDDRQ